MSDVRWEGLSHAEIYTQVRQGPGRAASADAEAAWTTVGDTIRAVNEQLTRAVRQIGVDWQGPAAGAAHGGLTVMNDWALDAADNATLTTDGIAAQAAGAQYVRDAMPPPRQNLDTAVALAGAGGYAPRAANVGALEDQMAEDRALAVDLMNRYTSDSSTHQELMNYWTQPPSVVVETVAPQPSPARRGVVGGAATGLAAAGVAGSGSTPGGSPGTGRAGAATPGPAAAGIPGSPTSRGTAPSDRPASPGAPIAGVPVPGVPVPESGAPLPGTRVPGSGSGASPSGPGGHRGRLPDEALPTGGVRRVVPGVPGRPGTGGVAGDLDAPWRTPSATGVAEPVVPRTGLGVPEGTSGAGPGARGAGGLAQDAVVGRPAERVTGAEQGGSGHGILPLGGAASRAAEQEHRRAGYLVDDTDAFADDRWFTPPVIGAGDLAVRRA